MRRNRVWIAASVAVLATVATIFSGDAMEPGLLLAGGSAVFLLTFLAMLLAMTMLDLERQRNRSAWGSVARRRTVLALSQVAWIASVFLLLSGDGTYVGLCVGPRLKVQGAIAVFNRAIGVGYARGNTDWYPGLHVEHDFSPFSADRWFFGNDDDADPLWFDLDSATTAKRRHVTWSFPLWVVVASLTAVVVRLRWRDLPSWSTTKCPICGYHRDGVADDALCPECGESLDPTSWPIAFSPLQRDVDRRTRRIRWAVAGSLLILLTAFGAWLTAMADSVSMSLTFGGGTVAAGTLVWVTLVSRSRQRETHRRDWAGRSAEVFLLAYVVVFASSLSVAQGWVELGLEDWIARQRTDASLVRAYAKNPNHDIIVSELNRRVEDDTFNATLVPRLFELVVAQIGAPHAPEIHHALGWLGQNNRLTPVERDRYMASFVNVFALGHPDVRMWGEKIRIPITAVMAFPGDTWLHAVGTPLHVETNDGLRDVDFGALNLTQPFWGRFAQMGPTRRQRIARGAVPPAVMVHENELASLEGGTLVMEIQTTSSNGFILHRTVRIPLEDLLPPEEAAPQEEPAP